jgi:hypothetical protein
LLVLGILMMSGAIGIAVGQDGHAWRSVYGDSGWQSARRCGQIAVRLEPQNGE